MQPIYRIKRLKADQKKGSPYVTFEMHFCLNACLWKGRLIIFTQLKFLAQIISFVIELVELQELLHERSFAGAPG